MQLSNPRDVYHAVRKATATATPQASGTWYVSHARTLDSAKRKAKTVRVARGHASTRDRAIRAVIEARARLRPGPSLQERLASHIAAKFAEEIRRRGGETTIEEKDRTVRLRMTDRDASAGLYLLHCEGWRHYSRQFGARLASLSYLVGHDDNGLFAVRVPGQVKTVADAIDFLEPAEVKKARDAGRRVERQGDVYIIEMTRDCARDGDLPPRHYWDVEKRELRHSDGHAPLHIPYPCKFLTQSAYRMGRRPGRGRGD